MAARRYSLGALALVGVFGIGVGMAIAGAAMRGFAPRGNSEPDASTFVVLPAPVPADTIVTAGAVAPVVPSRVVPHSSPPPVVPSAAVSPRPAAPRVVPPKREADGRWTPVDATARISFQNGDNAEGLFVDFHSVKWAHDDPVLWVRQVYPLEQRGQTPGGDRFRVKSSVQQFWFDCSNGRMLPLQGMAYDGSGNVSHHYERLDANSDQFSAAAAQDPGPDTNGALILDAVCKHFRYSRG